MHISEALERIVEEINALTDSERRQLAFMLQVPNDAKSPDSGGGIGSGQERKWEEELAKEGFVALPASLPFTEVKPLGAPLRSRGRALSELLVEERG